MSNITRRNREADPFLSLRRDWPSALFRDFLNRPLTDVVPSWNDEQTTSFVPDFDIKENAESFVLKADLPGIKAEDIDVKVNENRLTVSGKREAEKQEKDETTYRCERSYGSFMRSFALPEAVEASKVNAEMKNGVLTLTVGKKRQVPAQPIKVKAT